MKISETDWDDINVTEIAQTNTEESDIVLITCETMEDTARITANARNLPVTNNKDNPRLIMYVDLRAKKRYNAILNIAKTIRQKYENGQQTSIRNGKHDFLLRQKTWGDPTPCCQIPPLLLNQNLPEFEIGMYKNIYTPQKEDIPEEEVEELMDDDEDIPEEDISNEIKQQYENDKANLSTSTSSTNTTTSSQHKQKRCLILQPDGSKNEADTESDSGQI